jgi:RNA polymerase sigma-70 factor (ECF subfamily)
MDPNFKKDGSPYLDDEKIVELYWKRDEKAIDETDRKYRHYLHTVAFNILHNNLDCEECLNDTYLGTWNAIPPAHPTLFQIFISKIMRNTAVVRYKKITASKRVPSEMTVSLDELDGCLPYDNSVEYDYAVFQLSRLLSHYIRSLSEPRAFIFICRYYCSDLICDIADMLHVSESTVLRELSAIKNGLKKLLIKEGYYNE